MGRNYGGYGSMRELQEHSRQDGNDTVVTMEDGTEFRVHGTRSEEPGSGNSAGGTIGLIGGICFLVGIVGLFVTGLGGEFFQSKGLIWLLPLSGGIAALGIGTALLSQKTLVGIIPLLIGIVATAGAIAYPSLKDYQKAAMLEGGLPIAGMLLFIIAGICMSTVVPYKYFKAKRIHSQQVDATVIKKDSHYSHSSKGRSRIVYNLTWKYWAGGDWHVYKSNISRRPEPRRVGDKGFLWLNPQDPSDAWEDIGLWLIIFLFVLGLAMAAGLSFLLYQFCVTELPAMLTPM